MTLKMPKYDKYREGTKKNFITFPGVLQFPQFTIVIFKFNDYMLGPPFIIPLLITVEDKWGGSVEHRLS